MTEPKNDEEKPKTIIVKSRKKKNSGIPWIVGGALLLNSVILLSYQGGSFSKIREGTLSPGYILQVIILWSLSFIPGIRYFVLFLTLPITAVNVIIKLPPLLEGFTNQSFTNGKGGTQDNGKSV